jgi:hypothetical protein
VAQLCVNTLPATKITLITDGILFGRLRAIETGWDGVDCIGEFRLGKSGGCMLCKSRKISCAVEESVDVQE